MPGLPVSGFETIFLSMILSVHSKPNRDLHLTVLRGADKASREGLVDRYENKTALKKHGRSIGGSAHWLCITAQCNYRENQ